MLFLCWKKFDNTWLLEAIKKQFPDDEKLYQSAQHCKKVMNGSYFVSPKRPNKKGSDWQFDRSIILEDTTKGDVVLDILKDGRIGSVEYLDEKLQRKN